MRVNTVVGDRRLDRRKVAIVAFAAIFLFATVPAKAVPFTFIVDPVLSSMSFSQTFDLTALGLGTVTTIPQFPDPDGAGPITGSDTVTMSGTILVDLVGVTTSIELLSGGWITVDANNTPGNGGIPTAFSPGDPPVGALPGGTTFGANLGITTFRAPGDAISFFQSTTNMRFDWATGSPGPRPLSGIDFAYAPAFSGFSDKLVGIHGTQNSVDASGFLTSSSDLAGSTVSMLGTADGGAANPTWDPADTTSGPFGTLMLPIKSIVPSVVDVGTTGTGPFVTILTANTGVIYASPCVLCHVPEPSSLLLLGFGLVGLLTYGWRQTQSKV